MSRFGQKSGLHSLQLPKNARYFLVIFRLNSVKICFDPVHDVNTLNNLALKLLTINPNILDLFLHMLQYLANTHRLLSDLSLRLLSTCSHYAHYFLLDLLAGEVVCAQGLV